MICQVCGKNLANILYKTVINGVVKEKYICSECAARMNGLGLFRTPSSVQPSGQEREGANFMAFFESKFSDKAENAIRNANKAAAQWGHNYVGTEHLLYGLLQEKDSVAANVLVNNGIDLDLVTRKISEIIGINPAGTMVAGFTPRIKRVIEISFVEAKRLGHNYIGTEHLLMAILREGESVAIRIISELCPNIQKIYYDLIKSFGNDIQAEELSSTMTSAVNKKNNTPTLDEFGRDLTKMASEGKFDPVIGREKEIERVIQILSRRTKNNPCLIGEPGVGKTAVAEGLAQKITDGKVPEILQNKRVVTLDLSSMVAGAKYRGEFEERLKKAIDEIKAAGKCNYYLLMKCIPSSAREQQKEPLMLRIS